MTFAHVDPIKAANGRGERSTHANWQDTSRTMLSDERAAAGIDARLLCARCPLLVFPRTAVARGLLCRRASHWLSRLGASSNIATSRFDSLTAAPCGRSVAPQVRCDDLVELALRRPRGVRMPDGEERAQERLAQS